MSKSVVLFFPVHHATLLPRSIETRATNRRLIRHRPRAPFDRFDIDSVGHDIRSVHPDIRIIPYQHRRHVLNIAVNRLVNERFKENVALDLMRRDVESIAMNGQTRMQSLRYD